MEKGAQEGPGLGLQGGNARMNHFRRVVLDEHIVEVLEALNKACKTISVVLNINGAKVFYRVDAHHLLIDENEPVHRIPLADPLNWDLLNQYWHNHIQNIELVIDPTIAHRRHAPNT